MDGLYSFLLAFSLTLVEIINTLLIGRAGVVFFRKFSSLLLPDHNLLNCSVALADDVKTLSSPVCLLTVEIVIPVG